MNTRTAAQLRGEFPPDGSLPAYLYDEAHVEARKALAERLDAMKAIRSKVDAQGRTALLASEQRAWDEHDAEVRDLGLLLDEVSLHRVDRSRLVDATRSPMPPGSRAGDRVLTREQSFEGHVRARGLVEEHEDGLSLRKYVRGLALGDWSGADAERRVMAEGTLTAGGHLLPSPLSAQIIDLARAETRVFQAGARTVPMTSSTLKLARLTGDPSAAWHSENAAISASDAAFDAVTLTARTLAGLVVMSRELVEDTDADDVVTRAFADVFAQKLDLAALYGTGTAPEPRGVKNTTGVTVQSQGANGAALTSYDPLIDAAGSLQDNNFEAQAMIYAPRTARTLAKLKDSTGQPLQVPPALDGIRRLVTNQVPVNLTQGTATDASDAFVGDFRELLIGIRHRFEVSVLRERYAENGQIGLLTWMRADVLVTRPKAFTVVTGIVP